MSFNSNCENKNDASQSSSSGKKDIKDFFKNVWNYLNNKLHLNIQQKQCGGPTTTMEYKSANWQKQIRKSLRLNKSPKKKGYSVFLTDDEKRILEEYKIRTFNTDIAQRVGAPGPGFY